MKWNTLYIVFIFSLLLSCQDDAAKREAENLKARDKKEAIFKNISKAWGFNIRPFSPATQSIVAKWNEWSSFQTEIIQKPKSSIGAFQQKSKAIVNKADALKNNIPLQLDKPEVVSRIMAMITKLKSLDIYINLDNIPDQKVIELIKEANTEIHSIQNQMDEITRRQGIRMEEGEAEMLQALDTVKRKPAVQPSNFKNPNGQPSPTVVPQRHP